MIRNLLAGAMSVIHPGLGQIYKKEYKRGLKYVIYPFIGFIAYMLFSILWIIFMLPMLALLLFVFVFWLYQVIEAVCKAPEEETRNGPFKRWILIIISPIVIIDIIFYFDIFNKFSELLF